MATDGVKIVDGDWAHDVYMTFMDMYDAGLPIERIKADVERMGQPFIDAFDYEVFITAYALALWEIGELTEDIYQQVVDTVQREACALVWKEQAGDAAYKARIRETDKLIFKISTPKANIRKRKKHKQVTKFHFSEGDALIFKGTDGFWYATYLLHISQYRSECTYHFIPMTIRSKVKPSMSDIYQSNVMGNKIGASLSVSPDDFIHGLAAIGLSHKQLFEYKPHFEKIGIFKVKERYNRLGMQGGSQDWNQFTDWHENLDSNRKAFGMKIFSVADITGE